jgi:hypothetical protein
MLTRRSVLATVLVAATASGCDTSSRNPTVVATWRGRRIEVYALGGVATNWGTERCEFQTDQHFIVIRETEIAVDGLSKAINNFTRVVVDTIPIVVTVTVDGTPLFT